MIQTLLVCVAALWMCWRLFRHLLFSTALNNIPGPPAQSWLTGSFNQLMSQQGWEFHHNTAKTYGGIARLKGLFGANMLYVHDPKALNHILVKDQYIYEEQELFIEGNRIVFGEGIFTSLGERHRLQRKMLNPVFSIAHMREMVPIFYEVAHKVIVITVYESPWQVDVVSWMTRLALELIGQSGLGYTFDTLEEGSIPHPFGAASKQLATTSTQSTLSQLAQHMLIPTVARLGSRRFRRFLVDSVPSEILHKMRDIVDVLHNTSVEIFESKKKALEAGDEALSAQIGRGKDIISILMKANMKASDEEKLSEEELLGQITSLTFAATDTTSGALSRTLYLLALHPDAQTKVRQEIRDARNENSGHDIGYDTLVSLPYLDAICRETLRLYPPVTMLARTARQDIVLPVATPIKGVNGEKIHEIPVPKGTDVYVSILASNRNPELWGPDSYEWKPERWLKPLPEALLDARIPGVYSHLLTFIGGGRSCIGFKFSQLEMSQFPRGFIECVEV
ncbi:cytochrome P450 [Flammula alnicola]|nr:cytochrome P450 [Flammula alnicola]